jgi:hypothetical protein
MSRELLKAPIIRANEILLDSFATVAQPKLHSKEFIEMNAWLLFISEINVISDFWEGLPKIKHISYLKLPNDIIANIIDNEYFNDEFFLFMAAQITRRVATIHKQVRTATRELMIMFQLIELKHHSKNNIEIFD